MVAMDFVFNLCCTPTGYIPDIPSLARLCQRLYDVCRLVLVFRGCADCANCIIEERLVTFLCSFAHVAAISCCTVFHPRTKGQTSEQMMTCPRCRERRMQH